MARVPEVGRGEPDGAEGRTAAADLRVDARCAQTADAAEYNSGALA